MRRVIDASVALKLVLVEEGRESVKALLGATIGTAPDLFRIEVANGIAKRVKAGQMSPEEAEPALQLVLQSVSDLASSAPLIRDAMQIALQLAHPVADCVYLALARSLGCELVTADEKFAALARAAGHVEVVRLSEVRP